MIIDGKLKLLVRVLITGFAMFRFVTSSYAADAGRDCKGDVTVLFLANIDHGNGMTPDQAFEQLSPTWQGGEDEDEVDWGRLKRLIHLAYADRTYSQFGSESFATRMSNTCGTKNSFDPFNWNGKFPPGYSH
ncbi:hypothetical protein GQ57_34075 [Burkholderia sp. MSh2]|uniref:Uncharacterized protein n=1 Tax=Burkholderia paludis TaxID=1506587 RepID=A0A6J5E3F7_9BURK|nr:MULTISPECIES: hypothetical protein [Burkholderia]KEZ01666.1 hypothetical protein GQ57_34075 [Burkholderia sp. MSh2]CAB3759806.1 hypothetical protein LMG30113_03531 [Burkholderia paludis]VWC43987.1 hypothetical protein BPA30113_07144 [Burkholderia paludis]